MEYLNLNTITKLPIKHITLAKSIEDFLEIETPEGKVIIDTFIDKISTGIFSSGDTTRFKKDFFKVKKELIEIEEKAKEFLLDEWLNKQTEDIKYGSK